MPKTALAPDPLYCRKCSYDLRGQIEHRCPECGRPYDPADAKTFRRRPKGRAGKWLKRTAALLVVLLLLAAAPYAWLYYDWRQEQPAMERMKGLGATVQSTRIDPPVLPRFLPQRFKWMLDRVYFVNTDYRFTDPDLVLLARCRRLEGVVAPSGSVTDRGVEIISQMPNLRQVSLCGSGITDASAGPLSQCRQLYGLRLYGTSLTDEGLSRLCALPKLDYLHIESPRLTDAGLPVLANLPKLTDLWIDAPAIDDDGLAVLARLSRLVSLRVSADHWTPAGEKSLCQSLPNCDVRLYRYSPAPTSAPSTSPVHP